jgi:hypothetical protein
MHRLILAAPLLAMLAACGASNDVTVTNDNNVVLNDAQSNYAFTNDGETPGNEAAPAAEAPANGMAGNAM